MSISNGVAIPTVKNFEVMFTRFHRIHERDGHPAGQTDGHRSIRHSIARQKYVVSLHCQIKYKKFGSLADIWGSSPSLLTGRGSSSSS